MEEEKITEMIVGEEKIGRMVEEMEKEEEEAVEEAVEVIMEEEEEEEVVVVVEVAAQELQIIEHRKMACYYTPVSICQNLTQRNQLC